MCVLDCSPSALKMLHNSTEFMPFVIFIAAPGMEQLKQLYAERRATGGSQRNLSVSSKINWAFFFSIIIFWEFNFIFKFFSQFDRQSSIRYSSRRARTLESLASLYEVIHYIFIFTYRLSNDRFIPIYFQDDDLITTVEESALLQRKYEKYLDMVIINEDFDITFRKVVEALDALSHEHQWVPVNWIY